MTEVQMLLSGLIVDGLLRAKADGYSTLEVETQVDEQDNYLPSLVASMNGERYVITVMSDRASAHEPIDRGSVRTFVIPLPVTLVSMPRSAETYVLQDRWGWFWMVPPDSAGEPEHITEAVASDLVRKHDWDLVRQSFSTWEGLHYFLQGMVRRAATLGPQRDAVLVDHLVTVLDDRMTDIQHPQWCRADPIQDCGLLAIGGPWAVAELLPGKYRFYLLRDGSRWGWERQQAVRGEVADG